MVVEQRITKPLARGVNITMKSDFGTEPEISISDGKLQKGTLINSHGLINGRIDFNVLASG
jgi:hypothetical protein